MTWKQIQSVDRKKGISKEKKDSNNHKELRKDNAQFTEFGHMRVNTPQKSTFRIFGAISGGLFYILRFDVDGKMNH